MNTIQPLVFHPPRTPLEQIGFELGWDYAHHRAEPPAPYGDEASPLRQGLLAGRATFGLRTLDATPPVRKWLQLRLGAWLRGRSVELFQVTPNYLRQLEVDRCPITRVALAAGTHEGSDASIDRVRNDAGYAAGNLVVMSTQAHHAKAAHGFRSAREVALRAAALTAPAPSTAPPAAVSSTAPPLTRPNASAPADPSPTARGRAGIAGLGAAPWARVAALCSYVEPLAHAEAAALPMLVLPPNRLRLFNPVQALQALLSRQLLQPGWSQRFARFEDLLKGTTSKRDFKAFVLALLPRVLEAGRLAEPAAVRWAIEDAWVDAPLQRRWFAFAGALDPAACETLVHQAAAKRLATTPIELLTATLATEGWNLETRGYVAQRVAPQLELALQPG